MESTSQVAFTLSTVNWLSPVGPRYIQFVSYTSEVSTRFIVISVLYTIAESRTGRIELLSLLRSRLNQRSS